MPQYRSLGITGITGVQRGGVLAFLLAKLPEGATDEGSADHYAFVTCPDLLCENVSSPSGCSVSSLSSSSGLYVLSSSACTSFSSSLHIVLSVPSRIILTGTVSHCSRALQLQGGADGFGVHGCVRCSFVTVHEILRHTNIYLHVYLSKRRYLTAYIYLYNMYSMCL